MLNINKFIFNLLLFISISCFCQKHPFTQLQYDKVIIYDFNGGKGDGVYIIDSKGMLAKSVVKQVTLDENTIKILNEKLESKSSYGAGTAFCFEPHLGIVYFLKNKVVSHISICLDCNRLRASKNISAQNQGKNGNGKNTYYILDGMSDSFRNYLNEILKKYNFSHQATRATWISK